MRLPWLQFAADALPRSGALAGLLGVSRVQARGMLVGLWEGALSWGREEEPPDGKVLTPNAALIIAGWMEYPGSPAVLVDSLIQCGFIETCGVGYRVRGMTRYLGTWNKNHWRPNGSRTGPERKTKRQTQTQTQTQKKKTIRTETTSRAAEPPSTSRPELTVVPDAQVNGKPPTPQAALVETWSAVYLAQTGKPYRYSPADFVLGSQLVRQGVTADELKQVATRAFRPGISPYLQVRSFKQLVAKYPEVATARVVDALHNAATDDELAAQVADPRFQGRDL